jgi:hypothetical protein
MELGLVAAVDALVNADPSTLADSGSIIELHRQLARLEAVVTRAVGVWDGSREWEVDRARTGAAWLAVKCGMPMASARRRLRLARELRQTFQGAWVGDVWLDPINGTIVSDALRRIDEELFGADWAEAKQRVGRDPLAHELRRTPKQRRADALVEMAMRAMTAPKGGRRPEPLFTVFVGYETFAGRICELANGTVVSPGSLVPYRDEAWVERVVFDSPSRVIDVGVQRRCFEGGTRRAVQLRDLGECFEDICEERGDHLQIDHTTPWTAGGLTTQDNGRVACGHHNRLRNKRKPDEE